MNHYDRLKVSHDAPPEVIRAAYRALATKLHPDRQGADTGPEDAMHEQMAALNTAYEVLIDPKLRLDYDATLAPAHARIPAEESYAHSVYAEPTTQAPNTRVDMDWLPPKPVQPQTFWPPSRQVMIVGGGTVAVLVLITAGVIWQMTGQQQMEEALSDQYARSADQQNSQAEPVVPEVPAPVSAGRRDVERAAPSNTTQAPTAGRRRPTVEELSRMSDEELMRALPTLDGDTSTPPPASSQTPRSSSRGNVHHPLDGKPLNLRVDNQLIDPLAPEPSPSKKGKAKP